MIELSKIQTKLAEAIQKSGKTYSEIDNRIGVKNQQISSYIHGQKMPALDTFAKLCAVLDLDANDILCVSEYEAIN